MNLRSTLTTALATLGLLALARGAHAVGTRTFELDTLDDLSGGDLTGTSVDSTGRVRAGLTLGNLALSDATSVLSALALPSGQVLLGTSPGGKILRVAGGQASLAADTAQVGVTSLAIGFGGAVFAGTMPKGAIVKLDASGAMSRFVDLAGVEDVWALAYDAKGGALYAATGPGGKIFRIDASGHAQEYFDSDEAHIVSLAHDGVALYAGSSGKALLYRITAPGRASVVHDFAGEEVRAIAVGPQGTLYAIANEYDAPGEAPKRIAAAGLTVAGPSSAAKPKPGKGTLVRFDAERRPEKLLRRDDTHFTALALGDDGRPYVGTGAEGRVYAVDDAHAVSLVADTDERQVGALILAGAKKLVATTDPPVFHEVRGVGGNEAVWTSKVLDAGLRAHFGRLGWHASGPIELSTRTGDTQTPDATWSDWSAPAAASGPIGSPAARFIQVRARFARDPNATLSHVSIPFVTDNLRAIVTQVEALPKGGVTGGTKSGDAVPASGGDIPAHSSQIKLSWKVDNADADALRYRISYALVGRDGLREITREDEVVTKTEYEWETSSLPEGHYRVRVEASDEASNPPERTTRHALDSSVFTVDNTPPVFRALAANGRKLTGDVVDGVGPIARIEVQVDARGAFRPVAPKDGVLDDAAEAFEADLSSIAPPGPHLVTVRAFDRAGNSVLRQLELK